MKKLIIILAVIAMVGAFTATTMAAEWNFYGSARMTTFYVSDDPDTQWRPASATQDGSFVDASSSDNLNWGLQGNSRIGANVKFNDSIGGRFEYGPGVNLRLLYGTYNFDGGQLLIGQSYTPSVAFYSNSVYDADGNLLGVGQFYNGRQPMIQLKMGGFKIALIEPVDSDSIQGRVAAGSPSPDTYKAIKGTSEVKFPKIEVSYAYKTDQFFVDVFAGYQTYDLDRDADVAVPPAAPLNQKINDSIDSWVAGIGGGANFGAMFLKAGVHFSENQGNYGAYNPAANKMFDEAVFTGSELIDNDGFGFLVVLGYKASDSITLEAGYGFEENELDVSGSQEDETAQYYANLTYTIAPGFFVVPEIGFIDRKDNHWGSDSGDIFYGGMKWQINF
jgi:hypothetical protein